MELQTILDEESLQLRDKNKTQWYEYGNKTEKILAKILKNQQTLTSIIKILKTNGDLTYDSLEISKTFHTHYSQLYNINAQKGNKAEEDKGEEIRNYIEETALPMFNN